MVAVLTLRYVKSSGEPLTYVRDYLWLMKYFRVIIAL
jgi:hypothetical protein